MKLFLLPDQRAALQRVWPLLNLNRTRFWLAVLWGAIGLGAGVALGATAAWLIARASQMPLVGVLAVATTGVRLFGISRALFRYIERLASHRVALDGIADLRTNVYIALSRQDSARIAALKRGDLLRRATADVDSVGDLVVKSLLPVATAAVVGAGTVIGIAFLDVKVALILALCLLVSGLGGPILTIRSARVAQLAQAKARQSLDIVATTILTQAPQLQVNGEIDRELGRVAQIESDLAAATDRGAWPTSFAAALDLGAMLTAVIGALIISSEAVMAGTMSQVGAAVAVLTPLAVFEITAALGPASVQLVRSADAAVRIATLLPTSNTAQPAPISTAQPSPAVAAGISGRGLALGWPGGETLTHPLDLDLRPGESVAVIGRSGIGKSTLLATLAGIIPAHAGVITCPDGRDIARIPRSEAAQIVAFTAEDAHIFDTTVLENLRVGAADLTSAEALELLARVGLEDWVAALPEGLDTRLSSAGTTVSGGERRRLLMARALASPAQILALDEPAEHLDPGRADQLIHDLWQAAATEGRGIIIVTHRLTPLTGADRIIMLDTVGSRTGIVAAGTHQELLGSSPYYRWALAQEQVAAMEVSDQ